MQEIHVGSFAHLVREDGPSTIKCCIKGDVVRTLTIVDPHHIKLECGDGTEITVDINTPIAYQPWVFDRGNLLFDEDKKICTEFDILTFGDGKEFSIVPNSHIRAAGQKSQNWSFNCTGDIPKM